MVHGDDCVRNGRRLRHVVGDWHGVAAMCLGAAFGELLIMAGKPELNASPVAWAIFAAFAAIGVALVDLSNLGNEPIAHRPVKE